LGNCGQKREGGEQSEMQAGGHIQCRYRFDYLTWKWAMHAIFGSQGWAWKGVTLAVL
jgi:hypothetical protein